MRTTLIVVALVGTWLTAGAAHAQSKPRKPSPTAQKAAQEHYQRAITYKGLKDWDKAVAEFEAAHALYPDAEFHFLIAEVHEAKGDTEAALTRYQQYLDEEPRGRVAAKAKAAVDRLQPIIEAERLRAAEAEAARAREAEEAARERREAEEAARATPETKRTKKRSSKRADSAPPRPGRGLRIGGVITAGVGVAALSLGVISGLRAQSAERDLEMQFDPERYDQGKTAQRTMFIGYGIGAAALVGGSVMYVIGARKGRAESGVQVSGALGHGGGFAIVRGRF